jgi:hypothetical protein
LVGGVDQQFRSDAEALRDERIEVRAMTASFSRPRSPSCATSCAKT